MKVVIFNKDNVKKEEVENTVRKSRGVIINQEGKALIVKYAGLFMLPGGKIEEGGPKETLSREVAEEAGIENMDIQQEPFLKIESYDKNYYDRKLKKNITRLTETYLYYGTTQEAINVQKQQLTQNEKEQDFEISFQNLSVIQYLVETNQTDNKKNENFARETLTAIREFASYQKERSEEMEK